jgi:hypothetical protein
MKAFCVTAILVTLLVLAVLAAGVQAQNQPPLRIGVNNPIPQIDAADPVQPTPHPILSDITVRRAIAYCTDKDALLAVIYPNFTPQQRQGLIAETFIPTASWAYTLPSTVYPYNPAVGQGLLDQAGWVLPAGAQFRMRNGRELVLTVKTTDLPLRVTYLAVFEAQMRSCGIRLIRSHLPSSWLFGVATGLQVRDFEMGAYSWLIPADDLDGEYTFACDQIPSAVNGWQGQNYPGWCNPTATSAIYQATNTALPQATRKAYYAVVIDEVATDMPMLPLFWRAFPNGTPSELLEHIDLNLETYVQEAVVQINSRTTLQYVDHAGNQGSIMVPAGAVTETVELGYGPLVEPAQPPDESKATAVVFRLTVSRQGVPQSSLALSEPMTVTVPYSAPNLQNILDEGSLSLYLWDDQAWQPAAETCPTGQQYQLLDTENNVLVARVCHLSEFDLMGIEAKKVFLPIGLRR